MIRAALCVLLLTGSTPSLGRVAADSGLLARGGMHGPGMPSAWWRTIAQRHPSQHATRSRMSSTTLLSTTCYLATGQRTASGLWPAKGMAAGNRWPLGTRLWVQRVGVVTIADRIGAHSDLDLFFTDRHACLRFGRHLLRAEVLR